MQGFLQFCSSGGHAELQSLCRTFDNNGARRIVLPNNFFLNQQLL